MLFSKTLTTLCGCWNHSKFYRRVQLAHFNRSSADPACDPREARGDFFRIMIPFCHRVEKNTSLFFSNWLLASSGERCKHVSRTSSACEFLFFFLSSKSSEQNSYNPSGSHRASAASVGPPKVIESTHCVACCRPHIEVLEELWGAPILASDLLPDLCCHRPATRGEEGDYNIVRHTYTHTHTQFWLMQNISINCKEKL